MLSKMRITKVLIRLRENAGWSAPLFFAKSEDRFSHVEAHFMARFSCRILHECLYFIQLKKDNMQRR